MAIIEVELLCEPKIISAPQLEKITGRKVSQINIMTKTIDPKTGETKLDICYPFPISGGKKAKHTGPRFIVRNDKLRRFINYCKAKPLRYGRN